MIRLHRTEIGRAAGLGLCLGVLALIGLPETFGAHPFWARQAGILGTLGGLICYALLRFAGIGPVFLALAATAVLTASGLAAHFGKAAFAASYAEDQLAGRLWYFGWHFGTGSAQVMLASLASRIGLAQPA